MCSENKGADMRKYHKADVRLWFRIGKNPVFLWHDSFYSIQLLVAIRKLLIERNYLLTVSYFKWALTFTGVYLIICFQKTRFENLNIYLVLFIKNVDKLTKAT